MALVRCCWDQFEEKKLEIPRDKVVMALEKLIDSIQSLLPFCMLGCWQFLFSIELYAKRVNFLGEKRSSSSQPLHHVFGATQDLISELGIGIAIQDVHIYFENTQCRLSERANSG